MNARQATVDPTAAPATPRFARVNPLAPVGLRPEACLHLHKPQVGCRRCQDACPQAGIDLAAGRIAIDATRCTGCGLCASACPTAAMAVDGFAFAALPSAPALLLACHRQGDAAALRVPCLGGIGSAALLGLVLRAGAVPIRLLDDGSCARCPNAAGKGHPGRALLAEVLPLLRASRLPETQLPALVDRSSLPIGNSGAAPAGKNGSPAKLSARRAFFSGLGRVVSSGITQKAGAASPLLDLGAIPRQPRSAVPFARGHETRLLMSHLAARQNALPTTARLPRITVSGACAAHGACVRLCPTGALQASHENKLRRLSFDAWLCIDCGVCASACPERTLHYTAPTEVEFRTTPVELARVELGECPRCGAEIATKAGTLCAVCAKSASLAEAGFALLGGGHRQPQSAAGPP